MKRTPIIALLLLAMGCQKEFLQTNEPGTANGKSGLLQKIDIVSSATGEVYLQYLYEYNDSGKPIRISTTTVFPVNGVPVTRTASATFVRDAQGRTTTILYAPDTSASKAVFVYEGDSQKLRYVNLYKKQGAGQVVLDSLVFKYNTQGRLERTTQFNLQPNGGYTNTGYQEYTWDSRGNLLTKQTYNDYDGNGTIDPSLKYTWEYDDQVNPAYFDDPAIFYWSYLWPTGGSVSNVKRQLNDYPVNGGPDDELNYVLVYNADRKPLTVSPFPTTNSSSITTYTYYP